MFVNGFGDKKEWLPDFYEREIFGDFKANDFLEALVMLNGELEHEGEEEQTKEKKEQEMAKEQKSQELQDQSQNSFEEIIKIKSLEAAEPILDYLIQEFKTEVEEAKEELIKDGYATLKIQIKEQPEITVEGVDNADKQIIELISSNIPAYLYGPTGSGKTTRVLQIADKLKMTLYPYNQITDESQLVGFKDVTGNYVKTPLYDAVTTGGLLYVDEIDASIPEVLITLNTILANGFAQLGGNRVDVHPDFRVVASGNTFGEVTENFNYKRQKMDAATLDRFMPVFIGYNLEYEKALIKSHVELNKQKEENINYILGAKNKVREYLKANKLEDLFPFSTRSLDYFLRLKKGIYTVDSFIEIGLARYSQSLKEKLKKELEGLKF